MKEQPKWLCLMSGFFLYSCGSDALFFFIYFKLTCEVFSDDVMVVVDDDEFFEGERTNEFEVVADVVLLFGERF